MYIKRMKKKRIFLSMKRWRRKKEEELEYLATNATRIAFLAGIQTSISTGVDPFAQTSSYLKYI